MTWSIPCGTDGERREVLRYEHEVLDVCNTPVEEFRKLNKDGFRPLMLLAKGGATTAVLDEVLDTLHEHDCPDALAIAIVFASRVLTVEKDLEHLKRRRNMLDPYIKETAIYRWHCEEMDQDKLAEKFAKGREEEARQVIEKFVEKRFPAMLTWVKTQMQQIGELAKLQQILDNLFVANTPEEVQAAFISNPVG